MATSKSFERNKERSLHNIIIAFSCPLFLRMTRVLKPFFFLLSFPSISGQWIIPPFVQLPPSILGIFSSTDISARYVGSDRLGYFIVPSCLVLSFASSIARPFFFLRTLTYFVCWGIPSRTKITLGQLSLSLSLPSAIFLMYRLAKSRGGLDRLWRAGSHLPRPNRLSSPSSLYKQKRKFNKKRRRRRKRRMIRTRQDCLSLSFSLQEPF